jgi:hypothetical protein
MGGKMTYKFDGKELKDQSYRTVARVRRQGFRTRDLSPAAEYPDRFLEAKTDAPLKDKV